jgi:hypothetical protein
VYTEKASVGAGLCILSFEVVSLRFRRSTQTAGTSLYFFEFTVLKDSCFLNVRFPAALGMALRKTHVVTGNRLLATDFTLCHDLTFPLLMLILSTMLLTL